MVKEKRPIKSKDFEWTRIGNLFLIVDKENKKTHSLDPISFLVWLQCDGKTSLEEIVDVFSVNGNRDIIKAAISGILDRLAKKGLIKWV